jgi:hypothetical protein
MVPEENRAVFTHRELFRYVRRERIDAHEIDRSLEFAMAVLGAEYASLLDCR